MCTPQSFLCYPVYAHYTPADASRPLVINQKRRVCVPQSEVNDHIPAAYLFVCETLTQKGIFALSQSDVRDVGQCKLKHFHYFLFRAINYHKSDRLKALELGYSEIIIIRCKKDT